VKTSQPAVTRTVKHLEDVLGVKLFDRSTRSVQITAAGKEFAAVAARMLNDLKITRWQHARTRKPASWTDHRLEHHVGCELKVAADGCRISAATAATTRQPPLILDTKPLGIVRTVAQIRTASHFGPTTECFWHKARSRLRYGESRGG
jgi:hypothetical protein